MKSRKWWRRRNKALWREQQRREAFHKWLWKHNPKLAEALNQLQRCSQKLAEAMAPIIRTVERALLQFSLEVGRRRLKLLEGLSRAVRRVPRPSPERA
jgi:hypothetical protein